MKASKLKLGAIGIAAALGLFAFTTLQTGSIKGTVSPSGSASKAMAVSGMDTLKVNIDKGSFTLDIKPGTYKLVIEAVSPYKNFEKEGVMVEEGKSTNVGEITLQQ